jgi:hypothetical protein
LNDGEAKMEFLRYAFQSVIGLIFGFLSSAALSPLSASLGGDGGAGFAYGVMGLVAVFVGVAPSFRRAFGRSFLLLGACVFVLPLSTFVLSGVVFNETLANSSDLDSGAAAVGGVLAGGLMTAAAGFVGFVLGSVLLLLGLILSLGGRREVVVVERQAAARKEPTL